MAQHCIFRLASLGPRLLGHTFHLARPRLAVRPLHRPLPFEMDTNVAKDVLLFRYENSRLFRTVTFFGLGQYAFWMYLAHFANSSLRDVPPNPSETHDDHGTAWWQRINLGDKKFRLGLTGLFFVIGNVILTGAWMFTTRSLRYVVLVKGGQQLQLITYMPFVKHRILRVPLDHVSCNHSRHEMVSHLPLKVKGYKLFFILDRRGTFTNAKLFDHTAGMKRLFK